MFDSIYHNGFEIFGNRFVNEDGNANARVEMWLVAERILAEELGNTGTGQGGNTGESVGAKAARRTGWSFPCGPRDNAGKRRTAALAGRGVMAWLWQRSWQQDSRNTLDNVLGGALAGTRWSAAEGMTLLSRERRRQHGGRPRGDTYEVYDAGDVGVERAGSGIDTVLLIGGATTWTLATTSRT